MADRIIDGNGSVVRGANAVLVEGERIAAVGDAALLTAANADQLERLQFPGITIMPGLVNAHDHVAFRLSRLSLGDHFARTDDFQAMYVVRSLVLGLAEGVTLTRDMGAVGARARHAREVVASRLTSGPDVVTCINGITRPGGPGGVLSLAVQGPEQARQAAEELVRQGADFLKVFASSDGGAEDQPLLGVDEISAVVEVAGAAGLRVIAHATTAGSIACCLEAGVSCIEHGPGLTAELARAMAARGCWYVPTLSGFAVIGNEGGEWGRPPEVVHRFAAQLGSHPAAVRYALDAGVRIAVGTDSLGTMHMEMSLLHEAGVPLRDVLRAATSWGAELLDAAGEAGDVRPGLRADLLLVRGNPLDSLDCLKEPELVMHRGVLHRTDELRGLFASMQWSMPGATE